MKTSNIRKKVIVSVVMGSDSDLPVMAEAAKVLDEFGVGFELILTSAHRAPVRSAKFASQAKDRGVQVIIAGAGAAAHLAGILASHTPLSVIGVPIDATSLKGMDALLATMQMPDGIPVATMAIGKAGAKNAALFAMRMLSLSDKRLAKKLEDSIAQMASDVEKKQEKLTWPLS